MQSGTKIGYAHHRIFDPIDAWVRSLFSRWTKSDCEDLCACRRGCRFVGKLACPRDHRLPSSPAFGVGCISNRWLHILVLVRSSTKNARDFVTVPFGTLLFVAVGLMGNNAFYLAAIARIGPAEANVVHYLWPVFLVALASILHRKTPSLLQALGIACGFIGVAIALSSQMNDRLDLVGVALGACGALTFAAYSVGRSLAKIETNVVGPSLGLAGIGALTAHFTLETAYWPTTTQWIAIAIMGIGPFTVANMLWDKATREGSAATISSLAFLTPLVAMTLLAVFGLGAVTAATVVGALFAIVGAILSSRST